MLTHPKLIVAALTTALLVSASASQAAGSSTTGFVRLDLTASSASRTAIVPDTDVAFRVDTARGIATQADTTATTSAGCDACTGEAVSVHVLYLDGSPAMTLNNAAIAWDQGCGRCRTASVALQVAVVSHPGTLTADNRAMSLNAGCTTCAARSAAYQLVVPGHRQSRLSDTTLAALRGWAQDRATLLLDPAMLAELRTRAARTQDLDDLAKLVAADLDAAPVKAHARVSGH